MLSLLHALRQQQQNGQTANSKVAKAEEMHANLLQQIRCLKEEVIGFRAATEAAASRLQAVEKKKNKSKETTQEKVIQNVIIINHKKHFVVGIIIE